MAPNVLGTAARGRSLACMQCTKLSIDGQPSQRRSYGVGTLGALLASPCQSYQAIKHDGTVPGALDVTRERITHAHCPPPPPEMWHTPEGGGRMPDQWCRRASWAEGRGPFCVGAAAGRLGVHLLDFASPASPCAVGAVPHQGWCMNIYILAAHTLSLHGCGSLLQCFACAASSCAMRTLAACSGA